VPASSTSPGRVGEFAAQLTGQHDMRRAGDRGLPGPATTMLGHDVALTRHHDPIRGRVTSTNQPIIRRRRTNATITALDAGTGAVRFESRLDVIDPEYPDYAARVAAGGGLVYYVYRRSRWRACVEVGAIAVPSVSTQESAARRLFGVRRPAWSAIGWTRSSPQGRKALEAPGLGRVDLSSHPSTRGFPHACSRIIPLP
jgi:hypothetical protein